VTDRPALDEATGALRVHENLTLLPTLHQSLECAVLARRAFFAVRPTTVAIELPQSLEAAFRRALARLPVLSVLLYPDGDELVYLLIEPHEPMVEAARLAMENGAKLALVDRDDGTYPLRRERAPDTYAITKTGPAPYLSALLDAFPAGDDTADLLRDRTMAYHLDRLVSAGERVLWVGGVAHVNGILRALGEPLAQPFGRTAREGVRIAALAPESSREVMSEIPFVAASYEAARSAGRAFEFDAETDTQRVLDRLLLAAAETYEKERKGEVSRRALGVMRTFSRNLALVEGVLTAGFYELVCAARGAVDDDFAWYVFDLGATWPHQDASHSLPEVTLSGEDLFLEGKRVRFRRRFPGKASRPLPLRARPKERRPGDWRTQRFGPGICSHPPEDVVIERYGNHLRKKAERVLSEETRRVEAMTTSLLDGVDMKETLRRFHEGRLFVYEERKVRGGVGSVVVVFDEDADAYPWRTTWLGEHGQESDMAFYATPMGRELDGPGISRCTYGAFLMTMPPGRLADVWTDPDYDFAETPAETLLLAALDYAIEPRVVYAAKKPPRAALKRLASRMGRKIVYLPLGSLSSITARKLRTFHVLADRSVRSYAKDYIF
jgi:hypothetical protein